MTRGRAIAAAVALAGAIAPSMASAVDRTPSAAVAPPGVSGVAWSVPARRRLAVDIDALLAAAPTLRGAHVGLLVLETRSGAPLYARNADDAFVPASTLKLVTGSAALALLGPAYRFRTAAYADAANKRLIIQAGGDPLLRFEDLVALVNAVNADGTLPPIPDVALDPGGFAADPYPAGWSWDDFAYDYAAQLSALPVDENAFELQVAPGAAAGDPVQIATVGGGVVRSLQAGEMCAVAAAPDVPAVALTSARDGMPDIDVVRGPDAPCTSVIGSLPADGAVQILGVARRAPALAWRLMLAQQFRATAATRAPAQPADPKRDAARTDRTADVAIPCGSKLVWRHESEPLTELLADMWWPSDNFVAEMLLRAIGAGQGVGTTPAGAAAERMWLSTLGIDPASVTIADGSGLSSYDRITPRALGTILQFDWNGPDRATVIDDLPLAGVRGTLEHSFAGTLADRRTFAKTGSLNHTRGLAGYLATLRHGAVTFAWSVDDWQGTSRDLDAVRARVLARIIGD